MASFLRVSARCHDGLVIMESLSRVWNKGDILSLEAMSKDTLSPVGYLEQIAMMLKQNGLIKGARGAGGGYKLIRSPKDISVREVVEALEGPIAMLDCLGGREDCAKTSACKTRRVWSNIQKEISGAMGRLSIAEITK